MCAFIVFCCVLYLNSLAIYCIFHDYVATSFGIFSDLKCKSIYKEVVWLVNAITVLISVDLCLCRFLRYMARTSVDGCNMDGKVTVFREARGISHWPRLIGFEGPIHGLTSSNHHLSLNSSGKSQGKVLWMLSLLTHRLPTCRPPARRPCCYVGLSFVQHNYRPFGMLSKYLIVTNGQGNDGIACKT